MYDELHALASRHLAHEWRHDRLQTTVVVNEAYLRLFGQREIDWQNRGHFFAIAAQLMRRILVDHARRQLRQKRGGGELAVELDDALAAPSPPVDAVDALDLDRALEKLQQTGRRRCRISRPRSPSAPTRWPSSASILSSTRCAIEPRFKELLRKVGSGL